MSSAEAAAPPPVRVFGVRHHGPGSARALAAALDAYAPDCVLIEGPADADKLIGWAADPAMNPPVALLAWQTDRPANAAFWPMAVFSPEWQALALDATQLVQRLRGRYDFGVRILLLPGTDCLVQYRKPLASTLATRFEKTSTALLHYFSGLAPTLLIRKLQTTRWSCVRPALAQLPCFRNRLDPLPPARDARAFFGTLDFGE